MLPSFLLFTQNALKVCGQVCAVMCGKAGGLAISPQLDIRQTTLFLSLAGHRILPEMTLLAVLAPGFRARRSAPAPLEAVRPEAARILLRMRRDPASRFSTSTAGTAAIALEDGAEGHLLVHYTGERGTLTIAGGWLGAGRRRYVWLPLRPTLTWSPPDGPGLTAEELNAVAAELHTGLDQMNTRHVLEEFFEPALIPEEERRTVLDSYAGFMAAHGWQVTYDESLTRRSLKRTHAAESPQQWSNADREALTRLEALVSEMLKGVRSSSRILFQTK
jgi:hypothetical protein